MQAAGRCIELKAALGDGPFANEPDPEPEPEPAVGESPVGLWHLVVDFPEMPPFLDIIVFHEGGTLSESNLMS